MLIQTKVFSLAERPGLSAANVRAAVDDSLRRRRTDRIDLYFAHRDDPDVPQEEYVAVFDELVRAGKVVEVGASNFTADRLRSAVAIARGAGQAAFTVAQDRYNLVALDDIAAAHGVSVAAVALAWLAARPSVAAPIASARTVGQLPALVESFGLVLADDEIARLG